MNNDSGYDESCMDDGAWDSLFKMAENAEYESDFEGQDASEYDMLPVYDNAAFQENEPGKNRSYGTPEEALKALFGYEAFRPGQKEVIDNILSGRDVFAVMPTGAGKSVCYQIPAMLLPGITLVISPLISLMQDQVKALNEAGIPAAFINSSLSENMFYETVNRARQGVYKIIYVAPERLVTDSFLELAQNIRISMLTVDEAHCISQWGQDFRPSYMKIVEFVRLLDRRPVISAFTATATENVRDDIVCTLGLVNPYTLVTGFDRENLFFQVEKPKKKEQYILDYIAEHEGDSGIIYCATRKNVDNLYDLLKSRGISAAKYHAGMSAEERKRMQDDFVFDYISIVVATNAFGMGIDKSNVRFVIHYNMPQSMENYYQEAGRAGRDGLDSKCILLFSPQDIVINRFLLERKEMSDLDETDKQTIRERDSRRLQVMEKYCYTTECLRNYILKYFGENPDKPCGDCGNCLHEFETLDMTDEAKKIINCVYEANGRYGRNIIIDTVSGAKTARLEEIGAARYKSYGVLASSNKNLLRRLVEQLVLEGYLTVGDYQVLKMGDISRLKNTDARVLVKITDDDKLPERTSASNKKAKATDALTSAGYELFDRLRKLRLELAREENLPPYIIFSDKTLIDMAAKVPVSKSEMLNVSGVGENKFSKYGESFLSVVEKCAGEYPELLTNKANAVKEKEKNTFQKAGRKNEKQEFFLLEEEAANFNYADYMYVSEIKKELERICERDDVKKIPAGGLSRIMMADGLIAEREQDGRIDKVATDAGRERGIKTVVKVSERGFSYANLMYPKNIQQMLVEYFVGKHDDTQGEEDGQTQGSWRDMVCETHAGAFMPWTEDEEDRLTQEFSSGRSLKELSELHGRTTGAIRARLVKLKLIE